MIAVSRHRWVPTKVPSDCCDIVCHHRTPRLHHTPPPCQPASSWPPLTRQHIDKVLAPDMAPVFAWPARTRQVRGLVARRGARVQHRPVRARPQRVRGHARRLALRARGPSAGPGTTHVRTLPGHCARAFGESMPEPNRAEQDGSQQPQAAAAERCVRRCAQPRVPLHGTRAACPHAACPGARRPCLQDEAAVRDERVVVQVRPRRELQHVRQQIVQARLLRRPRAGHRVNDAGARLARPRQLAGERARAAAAAGRAPRARSTAAEWRPSGSPGAGASAATADSGGRAGGAGAACWGAHRVRVARVRLRRGAQPCERLRDRAAH